MRSSRFFIICLLTRTLSIFRAVFVSQMAGEIDFKSRHPKIQEQYKQIGGKSPLKDFTLGQAKLLEEKLNEKFPAKFTPRCVTGIRLPKKFWTNSKKKGIKKVILLPLYPQYSMATTESSVKEWKKQLELRGNKTKSNGLWSNIITIFRRISTPASSASIKAWKNFRPKNAIRLTYSFQRARHADEARRRATRIPVTSAKP
jgi:hypothetical protein